MPEITADHEHTRRQLAALGLTIDDARLDALMADAVGVLRGANRIALLDLGETEPAMIVRRPVARSATGGAA